MCHADNLSSPFAPACCHFLPPPTSLIKLITPVINICWFDLTVRLKTPATYADIKTAMKEASGGSMKGIMVILKIRWYLKTLKVMHAHQYLTQRQVLL